MQLIDEGFSGWYKKFSALALTAIGALQAAWGASTDLQGILSPKMLAAATGVLAVLGFIGRFIKQSAPPAEE
jgi:hypothetical protein